MTSGAQPFQAARTVLADLPAGRAAGPALGEMMERSGSSLGPQPGGPRRIFRDREPAVPGVPKRRRVPTLARQRRPPIRAPFCPNAAFLDVCAVRPSELEGPSGLPDRDGALVPKRGRSRAKEGEGGRCSIPL